MAGKPSGTQGDSQPSSTDVSSTTPPPSSTEQLPSSKASTVSTIRSFPFTIARTVPSPLSIHLPHLLCPTHDPRLCCAHDVYLTCLAASSGFANSDHKCCNGGAIDSCHDCYWRGAGHDRFFFHHFCVYSFNDRSAFYCLHCLFY